MERWIGSVLVDASPPEKPKFKSPLILIHGLWSGSWCWQPWATHFSNLGWECWAVNFSGRYKGRPQTILPRPDFNSCVNTLKQAIRSAPFPPVLMGHSLGGWVAQKAAEGEKVTAMILLSSPPPGNVDADTPRSLRLLRLKYAPLIFLRRPFRLEERDFRRIWLASLPESRQPDIVKRMVPESSRLISEFFNRRVEIDPKGVRCPVLLVCGNEDRVVSVASMRRLAQWLSADLVEYANHGHWMVGEEGGEIIVREIHRWLIQKLGEEILLTGLSTQP